MPTRTNRARCLDCNEIVESRHRHDFVGCSCFNESGGTRGIAVDGGRDYIRRVGNVIRYEDLSEGWEDANVA